MKKIFSILAFLFLFLFMTTICAAEEGWIYAGRFGLLEKPAVPHYVDMYLINHLTTFRGITRFSDPEAQMPYDVYYRHDHSTDTGYKSPANNHSFLFQVKIIPLNIHFTTMGSGYYGGAIVCEYRIAAKGAYCVVPKSFKIYDIKSDKLIFNAEGNFGSEQLYKASAAETILKESCPHPVYYGQAYQLNGAGYYRFR